MEERLDGAACGCDRGTCVIYNDESGAEQTRCDCDPGFAGETCNGCGAAYSGDDCELCAHGFIPSATHPGVCVPDPCAGDACGGRGECSVTADSTGVDAGSCACLPAFDGDTCGECAEGYQGEDCERCVNGYERDGELCVPRACLGVLCGDHGACEDVDGDDAGECVCDDGYVGEACDGCAEGYDLEDGVCVPGDVCDDVDCGAGTCVPSPMGADPVCECLDGYAGAACESCATGFFPVTSGPTTSCENILPVIGRRLNASFDAAAPGSMDFVDTDRVSVWRGTHGTSANPFWFIAAHRNPRYNLLPPAVVFDGVDDGLQTFSESIGEGDSYAIFAVVDWDNSASGAQTILHGLYPNYSATEAYSMRALDRDTVEFTHREHGGPVDVVTLDGFAARGKRLIVVQRAPFFSGHALTLSNGTDEVTIMATTAGFTEYPMSIMGNRLFEEYLDGSVHEVLYYEGVISGDETDDITEYLREKWSL